MHYSFGDVISRWNFKHKPDQGGSYEEVVQFDYDNFLGIDVSPISHNQRNSLVARPRDFF